MHCRSGKMHATFLISSPTLVKPAAGSRLLKNHKPEVMDRLYSFLYPEEYDMEEKKESGSGESDQKEEDQEDDEDQGLSSSSPEDQLI